MMVFTGMQAASLGEPTSPEMVRAFKDAAQDFLGWFEETLPDMKGVVTNAELRIAHYKEIDQIAFVLVFETANGKYYACSAAAPTIEEATAIMADNREVQIDMMVQMAEQIAGEVKLDTTPKTCPN